jgi:hypothetical protein
MNRRFLAQARVIAKGTRIRGVHRLVARYGGRPSKWVKKHWYEHPGIGKVELKQKQINQR